jgi:SWI/SNF-related matrix-associated actin-dependent regulator of chromatin subfamily A member 5
VESFKSAEEKKNRNSFHIIIVPKVTLGKWNKEIQQWAPSLRLFQFYGTNVEREDLKVDLRKGQFDVILTTFDMCLREKQELQRLNFEYLILDEAQRIKNDQSKLSQQLRAYQTRNRLLLTGTPLQNNLRELWSLLNFLMPSLFESS